MTTRRSLVGAAAHLRIVYMASCAAVLLAQPSLAQTAPTASANEAATSSASQATPEIIVTAERRSERLQDAPASITAVTSSQLSLLGITGSKELTEITPGLNFTQSVYSPQPTIRGIGTRGVGAGDESVVPVFIDGVYQAFLPGTDLEFNDVQRVEVLKGPQGALLGRNAMGGAINIVTIDPTSTPHGDVSLSYGSFNEWIGKALISGGTDKIAADLAVVADKDDGYIKDIGSGRELGETDDLTLRGKIVAHPTDNIDVKLAVSYTNNYDNIGESLGLVNGDSVGALFPGTIIASAPYTAALNFRPYDKLEQVAVSLTGIYHAPLFDLTALFGYQDNTLKVAADEDSTPAPIESVYYTQYSKNEYFETYATSKWSGPFSIIGGFVYYHDDSGYLPFLHAIAGPETFEWLPEILTDSYAAYLQGTYKFTDQWSLTLGGRYTTETKSFTDTFNFLDDGTVLASVPLAGHATFSKFTPTAILQYEPNRQLNFYVKGGQAFKSGIFNATATDAASAKPVAPETVTQYEIGMKAEVTPALRVNLAGYYTDYDNLQSGTRDPVTEQSFVQNAGSATIYGFEAEVLWRPIDYLNIRSGLSALHGTYNNFKDADVFFPATTDDPAPMANQCVPGAGAPIGGNREVSCNVTGKTIMRMPEFTFNFGGDYTIPWSAGDVVLSANADYQGKSYWDPENEFEEKPYTLVNARVSFRPGNGRYTVAAYGENLLDAKYSATEVVSGLDTQRALARPISGRIELSYAW